MILDYNITVFNAPLSITVNSNPVYRHVQYTVHAHTVHNHPVMYISIQYLILCTICIVCTL